MNQYFIKKTLGWVGGWVGGGGGGGGIMTLIIYIVKLGWYLNSGQVNYLVFNDRN